MEIYFYSYFDLFIMRFPEARGQNLEKKPFTLPKDLEGEYNLVIIPFRRYQQSLVDSWSQFLTNLMMNIPNFRFYEIPTLSYGYKVISPIINGGMSSGIPNRKIRERTITLYLNKREFKRSLNIKSESTIYLFLVRKDGEILWNGKGGFKDSIAEDLLSCLMKMNSNFK